MGNLSTPLERAVAILGGEKPACSALKISPQRLAYWLEQDKTPPEFCPTIERLTRAAGIVITCEELEPKVEWGVLRLQVKEEA